MALAILTLERGIVAGLADDQIMHLGEIHLHHNRHVVVIIAAEHALLAQAQ